MHNIAPALHTHLRQQAQAVPYILFVHRSKAAAASAAARASWATAKAPFSRMAAALAIAAVRLGGMGLQHKSDLGAEAAGACFSCAHTCMHVHNAMHVHAHTQAHAQVRVFHGHTRAYTCITLCMYMHTHRHTRRCVFFMGTHAHAHA
jgi:hypothetical protein